MSFGSAPPPYEPYRTPGPRPADAHDSTLDMLGVLYYVYAAIVALTALTMGVFALLPALLMASALPSGPGGPPPWLIGGVFAVAFGAVAVILVGKAVVMVFAGRALRARRHHVLCVVGACTSLMNMPIGTALGVYALITLMKPEVKARFEPSLGRRRLGARRRGRRTR
jgi:hypothetical protein